MINLADQNPRLLRALRKLQILALGGMLAVLAGCQSVGASGPSTSRVAALATRAETSPAIRVVPLDAGVVMRMKAAHAALQFSSVLGDSETNVPVIGPGDMIDISIWEAPPAVLFGATGGDARIIGSGQNAQGANLPQQEVGIDGRVMVPFVGSVYVTGRTTQDVEREIARRLVGKAHSPQAIVRLVRNEARNVTIVGEVMGSRRMPLSPRGERLLDAIAAAGGVKQPIGKTTIQVSRSGMVAAMPLDAIIRDPAQNIRLRPDDVITALFQPYSFIALGATAAQAEVPFEGGGISLTQALGRVGGLRDERADVRGVFIFRMEDARVFGPSTAAEGPRTSDGKIPVIYRVDLRDPASLFLARDFQIQDKDVVFVSNAPLADLQKFVSIVSSMTYSIVNIGNAVR